MAVRKSVLVTLAASTFLVIVSAKAQDSASPPAPVVASNRFQNGEVIFQSILISATTIRVNIGFKNTTEQPVYLWSSNYTNRCATASLVDDLGNEFECVGESLFPMNGYSRVHQGFTVAAGTSVGLQYQFVIGKAAPGTNFAFSAAPLLFAEKTASDHSDEITVDRREYHNTETLGINFSDLPAKVRPRTPPAKPAAAKSN